MAETDKTPDEVAAEASVEISFDYKLSTPVNYAHDGADLEASFVRFIAPSSKHRKECAWLKQSLARAFADYANLVEKMKASLPEEAKAAMIAEAQERAADRKKKKSKAAQKEDEKLEGPQVIGIVSTSTSVELDKVIEVARRLFTSTPPPVALIDGKERMTAHLYDSLSFEDVEAMTGEYLGFFFGGSVLKILSTG